jgi:hypothetical protein
VAAQGLLVIKKIAIFSAQIRFSGKPGNDDPLIIAALVPLVQKIGSNKVFEPVKTCSRVVLVC